MERAGLVAHPAKGITQDGLGSETVRGFLLVPQTVLTSPPPALPAEPSNNSYWFTNVLALETPWGYFP